MSSLEATAKNRKVLQSVYFSLESSGVRLLEGVVYLVDSSCKGHKMFIRSLDLLAYSLSYQAMCNINILYRENGKGTF